MLRATWSGSSASCTDRAARTGVSARVAAVKAGQRVSSARSGTLTTLKVVAASMHGPCWSRCWMSSTSTATLAEQARLRGSCPLGHEVIPAQSQPGTATTASWTSRWSADDRSPPAPRCSFSSTKSCARSTAGPSWPGSVVRCCEVVDPAPARSIPPPRKSHQPGPGSPATLGDTTGGARRARPDSNRRPTAKSSSLPGGGPSPVHAGELARLLTRLERPSSGPGDESSSRSDAATSADGAGNRVTGPADGRQGAGRQLTADDVMADPLAHARRLVAVTGATVLLKGATTLVVTDGQAVRSQADAPPWLATAGAGDVLSGVIGALLAAGLSPHDAASLGALVHGVAADRVSGGGPLRALAVAHGIRPTVRELLARGRTAPG